MKAMALMLAALMALSGCSTAFYVANGQDQGYKSMAECQLAHQADTQHCVDRTEYQRNTQNTWALVLQGILTVALVALTIGAFTQ